MKFTAQMTEEEAILAGLEQVWVSRGSKKQNQMAYEIVEFMRERGVQAEVIPDEGKLGKPNAVWRDKSYHKNLRYEKY